MSRGSFAVLGISVVLLTAGCVAAPSSGSTVSPANRSEISITVDNVTVERGEQSNITIRAHHVREAWTSDYPTPEDNTVVDDLRVEFDSDDVAFTPDSALQMDRYPPIWYWDDVRPSVTVKVPVRAAENATLGAYSFEFTATAATDQGPSVSDDATVQVANRSR